MRRSCAFCCYSSASCSCIRRAIFVAQVLHQESSLANPTLWIVYAAIFGYYVIAALFPIDKIIGRVYPVFGAILLLSAIGVFVGLFVNGYQPAELWDAGAAGAMGAMSAGLASADELWTAPTAVVGIVSYDMLGSIGGFIALLGVIVLPITSGDTALRALRCSLGDAFGLDMKRKRNVLILAIPIFALVFAVLIWSKADAAGFSTLWRYFSWANETIGVFALTMIAMYMVRNRMPYIMALVPGTFYFFIVTSYILNAEIGFNLPWDIAYTIAGVLSAAYVAATVMRSRRTRTHEAMADE